MKLRALVVDHPIGAIHEPAERKEANELLPAGRYDHGVRALPGGRRGSTGGPAAGGEGAPEHARARCRRDEDFHRDGELPGEPFQRETHSIYAQADPPAAGAPAGSVIEEDETNNSSPAITVQFP